MTDFNMKEFAKRLKHLREKKKNVDLKWTQGYVADLVGVSRSTYTAYENGTKQPPMETLNKIADLFNISTDYLHAKTDDPSPIDERNVNINRAFLKLPEGVTEEEKEFLKKQLDLQLEIFRSLKNKN